MIQSHFRTVGIGLFLLISLIFTACNNSDKTGEISSNYIPDPPEAAEELPDAPDFTLESYSGDLFTLSDHDGKVIVINFGQPGVRRAERRSPILWKYRRR